MQFLLKIYQQKLLFTIIILKAFTFPILSKNQLHSHELEETRAIANVRIHVERVIGSIRQKHTILENSILPIETFRKTEHGVCLFDGIVTVCCGLVNLCPPMVN